MAAYALLWPVEIWMTYGMDLRVTTTATSARRIAALPSMCQDSGPDSATGESTFVNPLLEGRKNAPHYRLNG